MNQIHEPTLPLEIEYDHNNKDMVDQVQAALLHPLSDSFRHCLESLQRLARNVGGKIRLCRDFAPLSFSFVVIRADGSCWLNGGVIFHGSHDRGGDGGSPTYSVNLSPVDGWTLHT